MPERKTKDSLEYKEYVRKIKKLGGKQIATPDEFDKISVGLSKRYIKRKGWLPKLRASVKKELASQKKARKGFETARTQAVQKGLRKAGLSEKEIARLRGKKK